VPGCIGKGSQLSKFKLLIFVLIKGLTLKEISHSMGVIYLKKKLKNY
jgi:hypothetical protein